MAPFKKPLVSIGIPTCNRIQLLKRTFSSLEDQSYENIEIIISDNASIDGTEGLVTAWKSYDPRIVYIKHPVNRGVYENYDACRQLAMGRYFMWLEPGEEIAKDILGAYVTFMESHPDYVSVIGKRRSWGRNAATRSGGIFPLEEPCPKKRIRKFYAKVKEGTLLYSFHRNTWIRSTPMKLSLVGDWHFIAGIAYQGKMKVLPGIVSPIHKHEESYKSTPLPALVRIHGFSWWWQWIPSIKVGMETCWTIMRTFPVYKNLPWRKRMSLAVQCGFTVWFRQQRSPYRVLIRVYEPIIDKCRYLFAWRKIKELRSKSL